MVIDCVANRTTGLVTVDAPSATANTRNVAVAGRSIVVPAMTHSDGPVAWAWISVQPPWETLALLIGIVADSVTAAVGARDKDRLPRNPPPRHIPPAGAVAPRPAL